jgi:hypothetical protein
MLLSVKQVRIIAAAATQENVFQFINVHIYIYMGDMSFLRIKEGSWFAKSVLLISVGGGDKPDSLNSLAYYSLCPPKTSL